MIDAIASASDAVLGVLSSWSEFLGTNPRIVAGILVGFLFAWFGTQFVKRATLWQGRRLTVFALVSGFLACFTISTLGVLSPFPWSELWISLVVGLTAPAAYKTTRAFLASRFPAIEKLSSRYSLIGPKS